MKNPRRYHGIVDTLTMGLIRLTSRFNVTGELVHDEQARGGDARDGKLSREHLGSHKAVTGATPLGVRALTWYHGMVPWYKLHVTDTLVHGTRRNYQVV